ncbi:hypothetical protein HED60_02865 [Planctomycetales bacterium ZRK34]|nr:hypothetical protein HED60_02865 [Planctomycetales bacterium ZRK34]
MNQIDQHHEPVRVSEQTRRMRWPLFVGLVILLVATFVVWRLHARAQVNAELEAIRAAGFPATGAELDDWYPQVDDSENAALVLGAVIHRIAVPPDDETLQKLPWLGSAEVPEPGEPYDADTLAVMRQSLKDNATILPEIHRGAAMDRSRFPIDLSMGLEVMLPDLCGMRRACNLTALEVDVNSSDGNAEGAADAAGVIFGLAHSLKDEPIMISQLVSWAMDQVGVQVVERMLNQATPSDTAMQRLIALINRNDHGNGLQRAMVGELAAGSDAFRLPMKELVDDIGSEDGMLLAHKVVGTLDVDHRIFLELMREYVEAAALPTDQRMKAFEAVAKKIAALRRFPAMFTRLLISSLERVAPLDNRARTMRRLAMTALAVERFRLAEGRLPKSLNEVAPKYIDAVPIDPCTGQSVIYKTTEKGFIIYGTGPDQTDDGGVRPTDDQFEPGTDAVFEVGR